VIGIRRVVDAGEVDEIVEAVLFEGGSHGGQAVSVDGERDLPGELLRPGDRISGALAGARHERIAFDLVDAPPGRHRGGGGRSWLGLFGNFSHGGNSWPRSAAS